MKKFNLDEVVDIVFAFAVEHQRATNTEKGKRNVELWVKAKLWDTSQMPPSAAREAEPNKKLRSNAQ